MKIFQKFYIWRSVPLQRRAVTIESDIFSFGNIIFLIPRNISFPVAYNMFSPFIDTILSQSHGLKRMGNSEKTKTRMQSFCEKLPRSNYSMYGWLHETFDSSEPKSFYTSRWYAELYKKRSEVNHHLKNMCNRKNFFLIDYSKKIKASHLNSSRLHLNRKGTNILFLSSSLAQHISKVFNGQLSRNTSCCKFSESDFEENESNKLKQAKENSRSLLNSLRRII